MNLMWSFSCFLLYEGDSCCIMANKHSDGLENKSLHRLQCTAIKGTHSNMQVCSPTTDSSPPHPLNHVPQCYIRDSATSLGSLFQSIATPSGNHFFLILNLSWHNLRTLPLVLRLSKREFSRYKQKLIHLISDNRHWGPVSFLLT